MLCGRRPASRHTTAMNLVFLGTPSFAVPSLEQTVAAGHRVLAVYTQPDRPKGRGQRQAMPPVKEAALRLGLPVHQPERVRRPEVIEELRAMAPTAMVVVGYGQIIPQAILDIAPLGIINVHASLLPQYRGLRRFNGRSLAGKHARESPRCALTPVWTQAICC